MVQHFPEGIKSIFSNTSATVWVIWCKHGKEFTAHPELIEGNKHNIYGHIKINIEPVLDQSSLANEFINCFSFFAENLEEPIPLRSYVNTLEQNPQSIYLKPVIPTEINNIASVFVLQKE